MQAPAFSPRAYGDHADDLDVPFNARPADEATTALLAACLGARPEHVAGWTLACRLQGLLAVHAAGGDGQPLWAVARCPHCGARFELEIDPTQCPAAPEAERFGWTAPDGRRLELRLPSGADLAQWRARHFSEAAAMVSTLVCTVDDSAPAEALQLPPHWLAPLAAALAEHDPLGALQAEAACPECQRTHSADIDLETLLLADFAARQRQLLAEVAALAHAFHWTEAQILALPAWRRAHYLARLDDNRGRP